MEIDLMKFPPSILNYVLNAKYINIFRLYFFPRTIGLDNSMYKYINAFTNNEIKGQALLSIRPYELNELGMQKIGHQEIVLEGVEQLRNFNYNMQQENLQFLALQVASTATNLHKLLYYFNKSSIETQILNDITHTIATIKPLVFWLDRSPFQGSNKNDSLTRFDAVLLNFAYIFFCSPLLFRSPAIQ